MFTNPQSSLPSIENKNENTNSPEMPSPPTAKPQNPNHPRFLPRAPFRRFGEGVFFDRMNRIHKMMEGGKIAWRLPPDLVPQSCKSCKSCPKLDGKGNMVARLA